MPDRIQSFKVICGGGLNSNENHLDLSENNPGSATRLVNYEVSLYGGYRRIEGFQPYDATYQEVDPDDCEGRILALSIFKDDNLNETIVLKTKSWEAIYDFLKLEQRITVQKRTTHETDINLSLNLDGSGKSNISTGIVFFDHMLDQLARHGGMDISLQVKGDLGIDEHHTIEDTAIVLGEAFAAALGNKLGIERYGFCLPMDDCLAQVAIDFGGRNWLVWEAEFTREMIGQMPTEMFMHFFKSFSDGAKANLNIKAEGTNEHHKIEAIFKAFAKAIKAAVKRDLDKMILPSTKGSL